MIYPTVDQLTKGNFNRYELAIATAKCARLITDEYVRQREAAEKHLANNKESDKPMISMIDSEYRDEKAVKVAINHIYAGDYTLLHADEVEALEAEREAAAHAIAQESATEEAEVQELPELTDADDDTDDIDAADSDTAADEADEQDEIAAE